MRTLESDRIHLIDGTETMPHTSEGERGPPPGVVQPAGMIVPTLPLLPPRYEAPDGHHGILFKMDGQPIPQTVSSKGWRQRCRNLWRHCTTRKHTERSSHENPFVIKAVMEGMQGRSHLITILLDTGAAYSLLDAATLRLLPTELFSPTEEIIAETITGEPVQSRGIIKVRWHGLDERFRKKFEETEFRVPDCKIAFNAILGYKELVRLGIIGRPRLNLIATFISMPHTVDAETGEKQEQQANLEKQAERDQRSRDEERRKRRHEYASAQATRHAIEFQQRVASTEAEYYAKWHEYFQAYERQFDQLYPRR